MKPLITIAIPHYKDTDGLIRLIYSIPNRSDIQIIVVDDKSFENSTTLKEVLDPLCREVEIYVNSRNYGAGYCRNEALKHCKGEWILFADSDDFFVDNAFTNIFHHKDDEGDIVFFIPTSFNKELGMTDTRHVPYEKMVREYLQDKNEEKSLQLKAGFIVPWSKMIRYKFLEDNKILFDEVRWSNDVMFSIKCAFYASQISVCDEVIYCATRKNGTLTTQRNRDEFVTRFEVYVRKYVFLRDYLPPNKFKLVENAPIGKVIKALKCGYGLDMVRYIIRRYREENIPLLFFGKNTFRNYTIDKVKTKNGRFS